MKRYLFLIILIFMTLVALSQEVKDVSYWHQGDSIVVSYDLHAEEPCDIRLRFSMNGGEDWERVIDGIRGDEGVYISPGMDKRIVWNMKGEASRAGRKGFKVDIRGKPFLEMVRVHGGTFMMGCTDEQTKCDEDESPAHKITLGDYYISRYEITNAQYCAFLNEENIDPDGRYRRTSYIHVNNPHCQLKYYDGKFMSNQGKEDFPVVEVTWNGAMAFCEWVGGRLPTEAEWEYAARGGDKGNDYVYSGADTLEKVAWFDRNSRDHAHRVGEKKPNELGIYDMSGNVWEWCYDWYGEYPKREHVNPMGPRWGQSVVIRGGSWLYYGSFCRTSNRGSSAPDYAFNNYGFRVMKPVK